jgi:1-aminocyclopropane-1-carboxylate deaminase/D-cysteine desulfhydrase-like pyridoxal-dependent ACC family enzyme
LKRDNGIGPAMGGNKARKWEFLMADALCPGKRRVVTFGGLQSNHFAAEDVPLIEGDYVYGGTSNFS